MKLNSIIEAFVVLLVLLMLFVPITLIVVSSFSTGGY